MAKVHTIQNSFNSGEISPRMLGRTDIGKYLFGAETIQNFTVLAQGGIRRRLGTRFVKEVKASANFTRLVPFTFSDVQAYILEFSNNLIRFYRDEGNIESGGNPLELITTYTTAELPELQFTQSADVLYIAHKDHPPAKLSRTGHTAWTLANVTFIDGPYLNENATTTTLGFSALTVGAGRTVTASAVTGINGGSGFLTSDVGRHIHVQDTVNTAAGWCEITGHTSTTVVTVTIYQAIAANNVATWRLSAFGSASDLLYPRTVAFNEQRLWWGANPGQPQTVYGSRVSLPDDFAPHDYTTGVVLDDSAIVYTIAADQVNVVHWIAPIRAMLLGTSGGIWPAQAATTLEAITPTSITIKRSSINGSAAIQPVNMEDVVLYVSSTKRKIWSVGYSGADDAYKPEDLTILADHITASDVDTLAYAPDPYSVAWCVRNDGVLIGVTYIRDQKVFAWHRHILGGSFGSGNAVVESIAVIPATSGDPSSVGKNNVLHDQVWMIVKRTINGSTVRYVEFMEDEFADVDDIEDAFFVDCGLTYNSSATDTITGLAHLEGETVQVLADGAVHPDRTVSGGSITLDASTYTKVQVGLYSTALMRTLTPEIKSENAGAGTIQGRLKRVPQASFRFNRTLGAEISTNLAGTTFDKLQFRSGGDPMDAPPPLFTGDKVVPLDMGWDRTQQITIRQPQPLPFHLLSMTTVIQVSPR